MTETRTAPVPLGQHLAEAARATIALRDRVLRNEGNTFEDWFILNMLATRGAVIRGDLLQLELVVVLDRDEAAMRALLDRLEVAGLVQSSPVPGDAKLTQVRLTAEGDALHQRLREELDRTRDRLLEGLDAGDVQTAVRTLDEVKARADELLHARDPLAQPVAP